VVCRFAAVDLHPESVPNHQMGLVFEELIRRFAEQSNETAGEHFTPREVIRLMVDILFYEDDDALRKPGVVRSLYDPACGTGGMLSVAEEYLRELNPDARLEVFGQELNDESFAICKADMMIKGQNPERIARGNSFSEDGHIGGKYDYLLSNPPFGVDWKKVQQVIEEEHEKQGFAGRSGAGLPRISDGSTLFLMHMISKMKPVSEGGSRLAIVFNGSPLFSGDAGSGESEIRRWVIESDWLEAIVGLPDQLFYNTGISTYIWLLTNRKPKARQGKIQLINAVDLFQKMKKSLGNKRNELSKENIDEIVKLYGEFREGERSKIFKNDDFGYRRIVVERPLRLSFQASPERIGRLKAEKGFVALAESKKKGAAGEREVKEGREVQEAILRLLGKLGPERVYKSRELFLEELDGLMKLAGVKLPAPARKAVLAALGERDETAEICMDEEGDPEPDAELRDYENVPRTEDFWEYFRREVKPHVPDAWVDEAKTRDGYEIPFTRHFYKYTPSRPLAEIEAEIKTLEGRFRICWARCFLECADEGLRPRMGAKSPCSLGCGQGVSGSSPRIGTHAKPPTSRVLGASRVHDSLLLTRGRLAASRGKSGLPGRYHREDQPSRAGKLCGTPTASWHSGSLAYCFRGLLGHHAPRNGDHTGLCELDLRTTLTSGVPAVRLSRNERRVWSGDDGVDAPNHLYAGYPPLGYARAFALGAEAHC
jgi:type I restriction enzyme M protein